MQARRTCCASLPQRKGVQGSLSGLNAPTPETDRLLLLLLALLLSVLQLQLVLLLLQLPRRAALTVRLGCAASAATSWTVGEMRLAT